MGACGSWRMVRSNILRLTTSLWHIAALVCFQLHCVVFSIPGLSPVKVSIITLLEFGCHVYITYAVPCWGVGFLVQRQYEAVSLSTNTRSDQCSSWRGESNSYTICSLSNWMGFCLCGPRYLSTGAGAQEERRVISLKWTRKLKKFLVCIICIHVTDTVFWIFFFYHQSQVDTGTRYCIFFGPLNCRSAENVMY